MFTLNRAYAEKFGHRWVVLSAKYGFVGPDFVIPESYDVTFKDARANPVSVETLQRQVRDADLGFFRYIVALGGKMYRARIEQAFANTESTVLAPFAGLPIGKYMQAVKRALAEGNSQLGLSTS